MDVTITGWGPDVAAAIDKAERLAYMAFAGAVVIGALVLFTLAWIAVQGLRR